jgi:FMN-dependent NADH-azoreductase
MAKLIYIKASPRKDRSHSSRVANKFIDSYRASHPGDTIEELDLWNMDLPPFDGDMIDAKYAMMHHDSQTEEQKKAWKCVTNMFQQFADADKYLFSVPMWNFGIPYRLKHYIDILTQSGLAFNITPEGRYIGLVTGKPVLVVYSSGGEYRPGSGAEAYDMQKPYLKAWLQFIGFKDIREIVVDGTLGDPVKAKQIEASCLKEASEIAKNY